jgi:hypothetical protein
MADLSGQELLLAAFEQALGNSSAGGGALPGGLDPRPPAALGDAVTDLTRQLTGVGSVSQVLSETVAGNTQAVAQNTVAQGAKSLVGEIGKTATSVLGGALGLSPLISGIVSLFGGGKAEPPPPLVRFALPPAVKLEGSVSGGRIAGVDYDQSGNPRAFSSPDASATPSAGGPAPAQITVQVQAMDSQSFLDHSNDIARAVRDAMLNMHSLNDVVSDL